ncbi:class E sortase [uncultured Friedmanniella sp.]|uniref:class E sortase n=1 Tax=uncultured Friedmanniella sp. TaxID=335381 RepID=UPI0035C99611
MSWFRRPSLASDSAAPRRFRQWWWALLIPVCAVAPWFVSWHGPVANPSADPSAIIKQAVAAQPRAQRKAPVPSPAAVAALSKELADPAGQGYDTPVSAKAAAAVRTTPGKYQKVGRIRIPRIGLNVSYGEGVYAKALDHGPGHWPGTPLPGEAGTSVLSGHRNTHTQPFKYLNLLEPGDKIVVSVGQHRAVTFRVRDTTIVREAKYPAFVLKPGKDPDARLLTLFACHPEGNPVYRIVVRASAGDAHAKGKG